VKVFNQYEWRDHAEIVALKSAGDKARGATLYVTLEPCNHTGRTGLARKRSSPRAFNASSRPWTIRIPSIPAVAFERLRAAGIDVFTRACEEEARRLNEPFACWIRTKKPFVTLKSAMTLDGQLALPRSEKRIGKNSGKRRRWITSEESRAEVHRMRHASDALLTGIGTILADDPSLTDRSGLPAPQTPPPCCSRFEAAPFGKIPHCENLGRRSLGIHHSPSEFTESA